MCSGVSVCSGISMNAKMIDSVMKDRYLVLMNPGQLGLGSSQPESTRPGQLGLCNLIIETAHVVIYIIVWE